MKILRAVIAVLLVVLTGAAWFSQAKAAIRKNEDIERLINDAGSYAELQLYQKAIKAYEEALALREDSSARTELVETYRSAYKDNVVTQKEYLKAIESACSQYPKQSSYWEELVSVCLDNGDYNKAYEYSNRAVKSGAKSEALTALRDSVIYSYTSRSKIYNAVLYSPDGSAAVYDGKGWGIIASDEEWIYECEYKYISPAGQSCSLLVSSQKDTRVVDDNNVVQAIINIDFETVRAIDEKVIPVRRNEGWTYYEYNSGKFFGGIYEDVSSFLSGRAVVKQDGKWYFVDELGNKTGDAVYDDVKLYANGEYIYKDVMIASVSGKYSIYDECGKRTAEFTANDMDNYYGGLIAYENDEGKWGYVDIKGNTVIEPFYESAKSFSNGLAAVNKDGMWGFINEEGKTVIEAAFIDAGYFSPGGRCFVSSTENEFHIIELRFNGGN